jgi:hypothetical protein
MLDERGNSCRFLLFRELITSDLPGRVKSLPGESFLRTTLHRLVNQPVHGSAAQSILEFQTTMNPRHDFLLN